MSVIDWLLDGVPAWSMMAGARASLRSRIPTDSGRAALASLRRTSALSRGSPVDTTINVLDGLLEFERAIGGYEDVRTALRGGEEYLLERSLFRRKSTGEVVDPTYLEFAFPYYWHYDVLRRSTTSDTRRWTRIPGWRRRWG